MRLIDADAAIKAIEDLQDCYNGFSDTYDKACIIGVLQEIPTIEAEPVKHGRWEYVDYGGFGNWHCTACRKIAIVNGNEDYCLNCGAKMDKEEHDER